MVARFKRTTTPKKRPAKKGSVGRRPKPKVDFDPSISLPSTPNKPPKNLIDYSWFIYGEKGIGKSTLAAQFPDIKAYFMFEAMRRGLKAPIIPDPNRNESPLDWARYKDYTSMLLNEHAPGRIVIDTLDLCSKSWEHHHASARGVQSLLGIQDHGRTWDTCMDDWINVFSSLIFAGWKFTFLSHVRKRPRIIRGVTREEAKDLQEAGVISSETQPSARPWAVGWSKESVAYAGYYGWWGDNRVFQIRGSGSVFASCENSEDHFTQPKGNEDHGQPYQLLIMGNSPKEAFKTLSLGWDNKVEGYYASDMATEE